MPVFSLCSRSPDGAATDCGDNTCCSLLPIYRPRKDERLSWPSWLTYSGRFTYISGHPLAVGRAQDSEGSPVKDQRSTAEPLNQSCLFVCLFVSVSVRLRETVSSLSWNFQNRSATAHISVTHVYFGQTLSEIYLTTTKCRDVLLSNPPSEYR